MIHEVSLLCQWNYVETGANPADDASRGTLGTRMFFFRVRREFSVIAEGQQIFGRRLKPREKNLSHGAVLSTVPVDLLDFYRITFTPVILESCGRAREEMSKD